MYLQSLELQGFKSFPDKIKLHFDKGLTAVVGPNGSGKSNIGDAVRWVLGEQSTKTLRGNKMEDVIFSGTKTRKAMGFAAVTLEINNETGELGDAYGAVVSVTRKLYRSGDSEYRINGKNVRLKDVTELFMDTGMGRDGYAIIGQGRIAEIVSAKSTDRRDIFEEAAGVSKFRYKKQEAQRKLDAAQENLVRLQDIVMELESRVEPLRQQAEKAKQYVELAGEQKQLEVSLWVRRLTALREKLTGLSDGYLQAQAEYQNAEREIQRTDAQVQEGYRRMQESTLKMEEIRQKIQQAENKLKQREMVLSQRQEEIQRKKMEAEAVKENLEAQLVIVDKKKEELDKLQQQEIEKLETISGLSAEEAKERLVESLKEEAKTQAQSFINDIMDDAKLTASKEAKRIVIQSIQRVATETAIENSVTVFHIESDEIKGRIIGREGRNIRALEAATGVEIVVDDTPEAIVLSAFDPVRREIARLALHQLVTDGRIHPARIEEVVAKVRKQVEEEIIETGKRTTIDLGIHGLHPELIRIIGKMKYRSSYGQNLLQHARETANLCAVMASELGLNPKKAKRAGLLHDIGKVPDEEPELPHALLGMKLAEKYKEKPDICNAIGAHHDETEMTSLLAPIVQVCDAISGARPGARREIVEAYIKRLNDLEQLAMSYPGVTKTYAIQAGRELRVIVGADKIDDKQTESLSGEIAKKIQDEMTYPGQVKITVIRETRAVSFAK